MAFSLVRTCLAAACVAVVSQSTTTTSTLTSTTETSESRTSTTTLTSTTQTSTTTLTSTTETSTTLTLSSTSETSTGTTAKGTALRPAASVKGSLEVSVSTPEAAAQLVANEEVKQGWQQAIADTAGVAPESVEVTLRVESRRLSGLRRASQAAGRIVVEYRIVVPADSQQEAQDLSTTLADAIASASTSALTETIAQQVVDITGDSSLAVVVESIAPPTAKAVVQVVTLTATASTTGEEQEPAATTTVGEVTGETTVSVESRERSFAPSARLLCVGQLVATAAAVAAAW